MSDWFTGLFASEHFYPYIIFSVRCEHISIKLQYFKFKCVSLRVWFLATRQLEGDREPGTMFVLGNCLDCSLVLGSVR